MTPTAGKLAAAVEVFAQRVLQEVSPPSDRGTIEQFIDLVTTSPSGAAGAEITVLNLLQRIGDWSHPDEDIQAFIEADFAQMDGSQKSSFAEMGTAKMVGWSLSEIARREPVDNRWQLESIMLVSPKYYKFEGQDGRLTGIQYYPSQGANFSIPMVDEGGLPRFIHIVNRRHVAALTDYPMYGIADCRLAFAAHSAWKLIMAEAMIAGQRQATPIIVGKADDNARVPLYDDRGVPLRDSEGQIIAVPAPEKLKRELQTMNANGGIITTGLSSDIQSLNQQTDGRFFMELLGYFDRLMMRAFLVPFTVLDEGTAGLGNAGLAQEQLKNMRLMLDNLAQQIQEEMLEKVIRPQIEVHFGAQETYGEWHPPVEHDEDRIDLLGELTRSFASGLYSSTDEGFLKRHRELAGIDPAPELVAAMTAPRRYWEKIAA